MSFQWYSEINNTEEIEQGDLILNCPIVIPPSDINPEEILEVELKYLDAIILSQSCDLVNGKIEIVLVCPFMTLNEFIQNLPEDQKSKKAKKSNIENLRKGHLPGYHLLNKSDENGLNDYLVVDFRNVYGVNINNLKNIALNLGRRNRLMPPYREHLSQSFARYFMRVGLPQDIIIEGYDL